MRSNGFSDTCEPGDESDFERPGFSGRMKEWNECGGVLEAGFVSLSAVPEGSDCVVLMSIGMVGEADREAAQHILDTFEADCGEAADGEAAEGDPVAEPSSVFASATSPAAPDAAGQEISYEPEKAVGGENVRSPA